MTSGWEEATALSTITLATVTAWLAWSTRRLAREAGAETRANWLPVVVVETSGTTADGFLPALEVGAEGGLSVGC